MSPNRTTLPRTNDENSHCVARPTCTAPSAAIFSPKSVFLLPPGFSSTVSLTHEFMLAIPIEIWQTLLSNYLAEQSLIAYTSSQRGLRVFPCVCRLWSLFDSQHVQLWPSLLARDFGCAYPCGKMNACAKAKNHAQAVCGPICNFISFSLLSFRSLSVCL
jgi:hypothetical protein